MSESQVRPLDRRSLLAGAGALASSLAVGALAAPDHLEGQEQRSHGVQSKPPEHPGLIRTALDCVHTGDISHRPLLRDLSSG